MESIVYEDTPLATYLEGAGEGSLSDNEVEIGTTESGRELALPEGQSQFAPTRSSSALAKYEKRIPRTLRLHVRKTSQSLSRIHHVCSGAVKGQLGPRQNASFLERFRYAIVASDLLSEQSYGNHGQSKSDSVSKGTAPSFDDVSAPVFSTSGVIGVLSAAFVLAGSISSARTISSGSSVVLVFLVMGYVMIGLAMSIAFARRKWLQHIRTQAVDDISNFVVNAQAFDTFLSTAVAIVQEVELVARGYRISTPLPPISRMDDSGQQRRCLRLRSAIRESAAGILQPVAEMAVSLEARTMRGDLERYHDIYEITRSDVDEVSQLAVLGDKGEEDGESLKILKLNMHQLFLARKILLCNLLALDADGTASDFPKWSKVAQCLRDLSAKYSKAASTLHDLLSDEERFASPSVPKVPLTPSRERVRTQIRKLGGLSTGIRGLQAKMHMLREEADRGLGSSDDSGDLSQNLLTQYDNIGTDLKALLQEWEEGRVSLLSSHNKRRSLSSAGLLSPRAVTPTSLSGSTANGGSPADAFRVLNGEAFSPSLDMISSDEEVFEAVAVPRQRSTLSREERIAKMREEREVRENARESRQANTSMLRELEMVLKYKPQGSKAARRVTVM